MKWSIFIIVIIIIIISIKPLEVWMTLICSGVSQVNWSVSNNQGHFWSLLSEKHISESYEWSSIKIEPRVGWNHQKLSKMKAPILFYLFLYFGNGVFHVFYVNRYVNIFLLHRNFFLFSKNMLTDLLTWNTWKTP